MKTTDISKVEALNEYGQLLLDNGFTIIAPKQPSTYFHFSKDNKIGYVQYDRYLVSFSTVHKPCKECGTGFRITDGDNVQLTLSNAEKTFTNAPSWAFTHQREAVVKYKDIADFTKQPFHKEDRIFTHNN